MDKLAAILPNKLLGVMLIWLSCVVTGAVAASNDLIESAHELQLAENPAWLDLIHLNTHVVSSGSSEIDDSRFYLATDGRHDAQAELDATLRRFSEDASVACQFPARWQWLSQYLDLGPPPACADLNIWKIKLAAHHLTLLFPAMYLQNPASMFGHTFLRFDQVDTSPLLVYTLSYAAKPDTQDNVLSYVYKGVFGGYPGVFAVQPYYQTVTEYGDIEQRDIWEYSLNLNAREIDQLLNHVWELRDKKINYYFLRENCAYQLLALLDVARPGLHLARQHFPFYAIPVDTVRSLSEKKLIESIAYRPARATRVAQMHAQLDVTLQSQAVAYADGHVAVDAMLQNNHDASRVLELATEIRQLKNINAENLLSQRSQLSQPANWLPFVNDDPITSHATARGSLAYGNYEQRGYVEMGLRPALHDWLDDDTGLIEGAGLEILSTQLRYYPDEDRVQLQQLTVFSMHSFSPIRPWVTPLSSELIFAMNRVGANKVYFAEGGLGFSAKMAGLHAYVLADMAIETVPARDQSESVYLGAHLGVRHKIISGQWLLEAKWQNSYAGYDETRTLFKAGYQMNLSRGYALRMQYVLWRTEGMRAGDVQLAVMKYF